MVDPVSGQSASMAARLGLQSAGAREPATVRDSRVGTRVADPSSSSRAVDGGSLVSEGREAVRRMAAEPPVDASRVASLRDAIASGRYRVDPERIADAMLRSEPGPPSD